MQWNRFASTCAAIVLTCTAMSGQALTSDDSAKALVEMALQRNREYLAAKAKKLGHSL